MSSALALLSKKLVFVSTEVQLSGKKRNYLFVVSSHSLGERAYK